MISETCLCIVLTIFLILFFFLLILSFHLIIGDENFTDFAEPRLLASLAGLAVQMIVLILIFINLNRTQLTKQYPVHQIHGRQFIITDGTPTEVKTSQAYVTCHLYPSIKLAGGLFCTNSYSELLCQ